MRHQKYLLLLTLSIALLSSCRRQTDIISDEPSGHASGMVYLSLALSDQGGVTPELRASVITCTPPQIYDGYIEDNEDFTKLFNTNEKKRNLHLFLFTVGEGATQEEKDQNSKLAYHFHYHLPEGALKGQLDQYVRSDGEIHWTTKDKGYTSVKQVKAGRYRAIFMSGTRMRLDEPYMTEEERQAGKEVDLVMDYYLKDPAKLKTYADFKEISNAYPLSLTGTLSHGQLRKFDQDDPEYTEEAKTAMIGDADGGIADGSVATYIDDNFLIREGTYTPEFPLLFKVDLKRWLAYVELRLGYYQKLTAEQIQHAKKNFSITFTFDGLPRVGHIFEWGIIDDDTYRLYDEEEYNLLMVGLETSIDSWDSVDESLKSVREKDGQEFKSLVRLFVPPYTPVKNPEIENERLESIEGEIPYLESAGANFVPNFLLKIEDRSHKTIESKEYRFPLLNKENGFIKKPANLPASLFPYAPLANSAYRISAIHMASCAFGDPEIHVTYQVVPWNVISRVLPSAE